MGMRMGTGTLTAARTDPQREQARAHKQERE